MTVHMSLVVHPERDSARKAARRIVEVGMQLGCQISAGTSDATEVLGLALTKGRPDVMVTVGGDGTIMRAAHVALPDRVPILGFNVGAVGFLAEAELAQLEEVVGILAAGSYTVEEHMTLEVVLPGQPPRAALNDVVFAKEERQRLISVSLSVNGEPFHTYRADALVIATPTGSTAYSLSAGGPVVDPDLEAIVVTPVAPHALFGQPVVFAGSTVLGCSAGSSRPIGIDVDGMPVGSVTGEVMVRRSDTPAFFVQIDGPTFPANLVKKLGLRENER